MNVLNPERFRLPSERGNRPSSSKPATPKRIRRSEHFLKGPIPLPWLTQAAGLPGKAYVVGSLIWYLAGLTGGQTVKVSQGLASDFWVGRKAKSKAFRDLERAGLVSIVRRRGKSPEITILEDQGHESAA